MSSPKKETISLKRTADEAALTSDAPSTAAPTLPNTAAIVAATTTPLKLSTKEPKAPTSEVKKQTAAQSLANLFQSSNSFDSKEEAANEFVEELMSARDGEGEDGKTKPPPAEAPATVATTNVASTAGADPAASTGQQTEFSSPRKKPRTSIPTSPVTTPVAPEAKILVRPTPEVKTSTLPPVALTVPATEPDLVAAAAAAAVATAADMVVAPIAVDTAPPPPVLKIESTPQRVAGASVLASLGSTAQKAYGVGSGSTIKPLTLPPITGIPTSIGTVQHDYLLQNLVHASKVTSPLPVPRRKGKSKKYALSTLAPVPLAPKIHKSRKDKSLGVLCQNFMDLFKHAPPNRNNNGTVIDICQVAEHLVVKRRRIYDVINILESIDIVCRVKKNTYRWHGKEDLPRFFAELQKEGLIERAHNVAAVAATAAAAAAAAVAEANKQQHLPLPQINVVKTKGMAQTCQKLIQIFLVSGRTEIGLTDAAEEVLGPLSPAEEANSQKAMKTKVRRMYDIANVLQSIGVLQKENVGSTSLANKPSFRWVYHILPADMAQHLKSGPPLLLQLQVVTQPPPVLPLVAMNVVQPSSADGMARIVSGPAATAPGTATLASSPVAAPGMATLLTAAPVAAAPANAEPDTAPPVMSETGTTALVAAAASGVADSGEATPGATESVVVDPGSSTPAMASPVTAVSVVGTAPETTELGSVTPGASEIVVGAPGAADAAVATPITVAPDLAAAPGMAEPDAATPTVSEPVVMAPVADPTNEPGAVTPGTAAPGMSEVGAAMPAPGTAAPGATPVTPKDASPDAATGEELVVPI